MKKIGLVAVLSLFGAMIWTTGCGGGTPNCDAAVADTQACCDKATSSKASCDAIVSTLKSAQSAAATLGTDCGATTVDCKAYP